ncbi:chemokine vCXCL1 [Human betaherpesvirus 5]|uniref:VCXCL1 n=1 Tax=Human cytomegalovirus TaxID=10359 RepID=Q5S210_HCMV|nr:UL146 [Human betaherpesvirus 5]AAV65623.1 UL146 [Human betaherpesvirus 5]AAV65624.1 UL146 [Human betaherpesvirus 5]AKI09682.1 chemokine vCXCL1 [Human betaherpesvirus 5]AKI22882.1 chemokine vCXCL1 [Human betaherpesvirus 5]
MRFIFSLFGLLIALYYKVESVELRCPCGSNGLSLPIGGFFWIGYNPPDPPKCEKPQHFLLPPKGKPVCLSPDHVLSKWLHGKSSNTWHKVLLRTKGGDGPHVEERTASNGRPPWKLKF